ncbi:MAG: hypothetical protein Q4B34_02125 [Candidatus Saccharibacteria bacterium]|nr:hypothetical protein [Candidatus Saccharibacteria bacterium]
MSIKELLKKPRVNFRNYSSRPTYDDLVNAESRIGRTLFGPIPEGHQREFFTAKKNVWIWYERFIDAAGVMQEMTIRYEVRPAGVYKKVANGGYAKLEGAELDNFRKAAKKYLELVKDKLYC